MARGLANVDPAPVPQVNLNIQLLKPLALAWTETWATWLGASSSPAFLFPNGLKPATNPGIMADAPFVNLQLKRADTMPGWGRPAATMYVTSPARPISLRHLELLLSSSTAAFTTLKHSFCSSAVGNVWTTCGATSSFIPSAESGDTALCRGARRCRGALEVRENADEEETRRSVKHATLLAVHIIGSPRKKPSP
eukprot:CAMPEP_0169460018 /NCGR_PEP_ID=MMETSP1042-20121227/18255_1 /TAXON_ID=464988 /ORGANISM="Hemiselmis andersenii, Strain CCMP1180" /LENGTH=194 /DNA_ID=CAMNT_0009572465 /DNA_START=102 /DNA_END=684 /DNA_ORIENTATION=-